MNCSICNNPVLLAFEATVLKKHNGKFYHCSNCGFLQIDSPTWLDEAYSRSINLSDVGYVTRNVYLSKITLVVFTLIFGRNGKYLDYGAGHGILVRLLRDYGLDFYWQDLYTENLFAERFEYTGQRINALTSFECFEHFEEPIVELEKIFKISKNIFFTTQLLPDGEIPQPGQWNYYGLSHGQHIAFYSKKTFLFLANKYNLQYVTDGKFFHMLTERPISKFKFKFLLLLSRLQFDIFLRKVILKSKIEQDYELMING